MENKNHKGLTSHEVEVSRDRYGANKLTRKKQKPLARSFLENLGDPVIRVLLISLTLNLIFTFRNIDWLETGGIALAIFAATLISTLSEHSSSAAFEKLDLYSKTKARVKRDNKIIETFSEELVVGDVVLLSAGERICADGILVSGEISLDQSALTGESKEKTKIPLDKNGATQDLSPSSKHACLSGCSVLSGEGEMEITRVGDSTLLGSIVGELQANVRQSPLKLRLTKLAKQISVLGYGAAVLIALLSLFSSICIESDFVREVMLSKLTNAKFLVGELFRAITLGLTVVIMSVPEGLPMMIAVVLSSNVKRMLFDKVLIKKQTGIEAAGCMNILFTDKTGTLTRGRMSVEKFILPSGEIVKGINALKDKYPQVFASFCENCVHNTSAVLSERNIMGGNATERALLDSIKKYAKANNIEIISKIPFDSKSKFSSASTRKKTYLKGAPEVIFKMISRESFDPLSVSNSITGEQSAGKRVIALAENGEFICAAVISDPPRREARASVEQLKGAGIDVVMITGDSPLTAKSIAEQTGIVSARKDIILTHTDMEKMSDEELTQALPRLALLARALPQDKSRLVRLSQEMGLVVGMTGDGVNDAPALRSSDVGFSMGDGSDVAKEASDIVILDNNLASIVKAVLYGRNTFKSIRKFLVFQLTMNFSCALLCMIAPFFGIESPITVTQMLWVNMIMDTLGGLAFAGEAPQRRIMKEKPKRRDEPILNSYMAHQIIISGGFSGIFSIIFLKHPFFTSHFRSDKNDLILLSAFFALYVFLGVAQCINSRTDRLNLLVGIRKNPTFVGIMILILGIQLTFIYFGGELLRTAPLYPSELAFTVLCAICAIPFEFLRKALWRFTGHNNGF